MSRKRRGARSTVRAAARAVPRHSDAAGAIAAAALLLAILCVGLVVDTGADAAFDAPKRLTSLLFIAAAAAALSFSPWRNPFSQIGPTSPRGLTLLLTAGALAWAILSSLRSPHGAASRDSTRVLLLYALLLPIGASRVLHRSRRLLLGAFLAVLAVDSGVSILQARGLYRPFSLVTERGSREATGAFVGNVGYLALALALAAVASLAVLLCAHRAAVKVCAAGATLLFGAGMLVNQNLTALSALLVGAAILSFGLFGRRAVLPAAAAILLLAGAVASYRPMRSRVTVALAAARAGNWDQLVTYRVGAWKAAIAMTREKPLLGFGPGTFGAEFVPHRLAAEIASRRRYGNPTGASSYAETHCDYLQPFAEAGVPAGLAVLGAVFFLFLGLARSARRQPSEDRAERIFLLAFLGAGAAAALTWFPMQRPVCAIPLLLAAGRSWRLSDLSGGRKAQKAA